MLLARMDEYGKAAWLEVAVLTSRAACPLGRAVFAFLVGNGRRRAWREKAFHSLGRWSSAAASRSSGNAAVNTCRTVELGCFKVQEQEFRPLLNRLCLARNNREFDRLMAGQRHAGAMRLPSSQPCS